MSLRSLLLVFALLGAAPAVAEEITGAGATFPAPAYAQWGQGYKADAINYHPVGSGAGIDLIKAGTVDFGASDMPLSADDLRTAGLIQFPAIMGGIVVSVNLPGIGPNQLRLDGATLAAIYLGRITRWDDPAITTANPGLALPATAIVAIHRSDKSGTTFLFTSYLAQVSSEWRDRMHGGAPLVAWPDGLGGKGNDGISKLAADIPGSIAYVEYAFAKEKGLAWTQLRARDGAWLSPALHTFQDAALGVDWERDPILVNRHGADAWPLTGASFILMRATQSQPARGQAVARFFDWAFTQQTEVTQSLGYVPLPPDAVRIVETGLVASLHTPDGRPLLVGKTR